MQDALMNRSNAYALLRRFAQEECGSQLVEFGISVVVVLTIIFGVMDFSRAMYSYHFANSAAQQATRYAAVRGAGWTPTSCSTAAPPNFTMSFACQAASTDVQNYVRSLSLPLIKTSDITAVTTWPGTTPTCTGACSTCTTPNSKGCYVQVTVKHKFAFFMPFLPRSAGFTINSSSQRVIQQ